MQIYKQSNLNLKLTAHDSFKRDFVMIFLLILFLNNLQRQVF